MNKLMKQFSMPTLLPNNLFDEIEEMFMTLPFYDQRTKTCRMKTGFPKGDIFMDKDGNEVIELFLAGYKKEQLSVSVQDNSLVVSATKCDEDDEGRSFTRTRQAFSRKFIGFNDRVHDLSAAEVTYENGLLRIVVPKKEIPENQEVKLEIK